VGQPMLVTRRFDPPLFLTVTNSVNNMPVRNSDVSHGTLSWSTPKIFCCDLVVVMGTVEHGRAYCEEEFERARLKRGEVFRVARTAEERTHSRNQQHP